MFAQLELNPTKQKLAEFAGGMIFVSLLAIPFSIYLLNGLASQLWVQLTLIGIVASVFFTACRFLFPMVLKPLYVVWVGLSVLIGMIIGPILLTLIYFLVITPIGFLSKATGKTWLETKTKDSYWVKLEPHTKESYKKQF